ncbi:MAG TPA: choice-of-anchor D domain-containing protein [Bryobacteraceae bacterium]|nr:choice-of-anchor D domain-containing protein [Bryobacteraceae bacterium]
MRLCTALSGALLLLLSGGRPSQAQTTPFTLLVTENGISATVPNNSTIPVNSSTGGGVTVTVKATYVGDVPATVAQPPSTLGSTEFSASIPGTLPVVLNQGDVLTMNVVFQPTSSLQATAQVTLLFTYPSTTSGTTTTVQGAIVLGFQGTSPQFTLTYVLQSTNNAVSLPSTGGTLLFPPTAINTTALANLDINNTGSGSGQITAITMPKGPAFKVQGLPPFPVTVGSNQTLPLTVSYTPTAVQTDMDQIQITYQAGNTVTVVLQGSGTSAAFTYSYILNGKSTSVSPNGTIPLPNTNVGDTSNLIVTVLNKGNATGTVNSVSISGPGFQFFGTLPLFPQTLQQGGTFSFSISFTPTTAGTVQGELVIGSDLFNLSGEGLGPTLAFSYISSAGTITLPPATAVVFSPAAVGQSEQLTFVVTNSGTLTAVISNIGISASTSPFGLSGLAPLPLSLAPGQSSKFTLTFTPATTGFSNGTLMLDTTSVALVGSGTAPPPLPSYTIQGPSGNASPLTQAPVSITLSNSYPLDLTGTLTLATSGDFGTDPTVQFDTSGRTVNFTIPANSTEADFANQGSQVLLQTGTVAETVTLTPAFATGAGGVNVTPASPTTLQFTIPSQAPVLLSVQATSQTSNSFILLVTGYATTRSLSGLTVTFTAAAGHSISSAPVPIDVSQAATVWFQSSASQAFGGQFLITIPFTLQGPNPPTGKTLLDSLASVAATVNNTLGTSNSLQTNVQ